MLILLKALTKCRLLKKEINYFVKYFCNLVIYIFKLITITKCIKFFVHIIQIFEKKNIVQTIIAPPSVIILEDHSNYLSHFRKPFCVSWYGICGPKGPGARCEGLEINNKR